MKRLSFTFRGSMLLFAVSLAACAPQPDAGSEAVPAPAPDRDAAEKAIAHTRQQLVTALNTDDVDGIMACLTDDHVTLPPDVPAPKDLAELRRYHENRIKETGIEITPTLSDLEFAGDWAFQQFASAITMTPRAGGDAVSIHIKGIWIWKRQPDGSWKLARSVWNNDSPLSPPPST